MKKIGEALLSCSLFQHLPTEVLVDLATKVNVRVLWKGEMILNEGDWCKHFGLLLSGILIKQKCNVGGELCTIDLINPGESYGEDCIFSFRPQLPYGIEALSTVKLLTLPLPYLAQMIERHAQFRYNYYRYIEASIKAKEQRIATLLQKTLRQKILSYLLCLYEIQKVKKQGTELSFSHNPQGKYILPENYGGQPPTTHVKQAVQEASLATFSSSSNKEGRQVSEVSTSALENTVHLTLPSSKELVARILNIPRPSLSRELLKLEEEGYIQCNGRNIQMLDLKKIQLLQGYLMPENE